MTDIERAHDNLFGIIDRAFKNNERTFISKKGDKRTSKLGFRCC